MLQYCFTGCMCSILEKMIPVDKLLAVDEQ